ncbi:hypothetical protein [Cedratvirus kamchatka]|uniref:Uncharacterized protein n=1 Tax=Cedratvirus kamchatka TaxID=2716914 RepID=A0A6G8MX78_9VIRU|nr:hypothetical protein [Cedratvirus kamchatka]
MTTFTRKHVWYQSFSLVNKGIQSRKGHIRYQSSSLVTKGIQSRKGYLCFLSR